jgi:hypothetical protein
MRQENLPDQAKMQYNERENSHVNIKRENKGLAKNDGSNAPTNN